MGIYRVGGQGWSLRRRAAAFLIRADARALPLADRSVQCVVTSPPYWGLRNYGRRKQLGLEATPDAYVAALVAVFAEIRRVLKDDGTVWLNLGDSYATGGGKVGASPGGGAQGARWAGPTTQPNRLPIVGLKAKDLAMIPARVALALQADGWYLRADIIWAKPNPTPESVTDRPTKAHEHLFLLTKSKRYFYDADAIKEPMAEARAARYAYGFGGAKNEQLTAAAAIGPGTRTRVIGARVAGGLRATARLHRDEIGSPSQMRSLVSETGDRYMSGRVHAKHARDRGIQPTRNKRSVWTINTQSYKGAHFATMPEKLVEPCILAGSKPGDVCLDPFVGSGTVVAVAQRLGRRGVGVDLRYQNLAKVRTAPILKGAA